MKATEQEGAASEVTRTVSTGRDAAPTNGAVTAELELAVPTGAAAAALAGLPLRFGVPVPRATLHRTFADARAGGGGKRSPRCADPQPQPLAGRVGALGAGGHHHPGGAGRAAPLRAPEGFGSTWAAPAARGTAGPLTCSRDT